MPDPILSIIAFAAAGVMQPEPAPQPSAVRADERVVLFPGVGRRDESGAWRCELRGWIFEPEDGSPARAAARRAFAKGLGLSDEESATDTFKSRASSFLVDNERGKRVAVRAGANTVVSGESDAGGHFSIELTLDASHTGGQAASVALPAGDARAFAGTIRLIPPVGLSVISDIDDTIKVSNVLDRSALLRNTFVRPFEPVPGMSSLYSVFARGGAEFHYVSGSPWQLYEPIASFVADHGFPPGTFAFRRFRAKDETFLSLLDDPAAYKLGAIEPILQGWPDRKFVLIGDSGEKDPEVYTTLARRFPSRVVCILIRDVTGEGADSARYAPLLEGLAPGLFVVFTDPAGVTGKARELAPPPERE